MTGAGRGGERGPALVRLTAAMRVVIGPVVEVALVPTGLAPVGAVAEAGRP